MEVRAVDDRARLPLPPHSGRRTRHTYRSSFECRISSTDDTDEKTIECPSDDDTGENFGFAIASTTCSRGSKGVIVFEITAIEEDDESKQIWGLRYDCSTARVTDHRCLIECWHSLEEKMGPVQHTDVLVYFKKLTSRSRIPKSAQDAIAASCFRVGEELPSVPGLDPLIARLLLGNPNLTISYNAPGGSQYNPIERYWRAYANFLEENTEVD